MGAASPSAAGASSADCVAAFGRGAAASAWLAAASAGSACVGSDVSGSSLDLKKTQQLN